jgi:poly-gamma-glutamate synthesis protein (capsule biosynthesis protein)
MKFLLICTAFFFLFASCVEKQEIDYLDLNTGFKAGFDSGIEADTLASIISKDTLASIGLVLKDPGDTQDETGGAQTVPESGVAIDFFSYWEYEEPRGDLIIAREWFVPAHDPIDRLKSISLEQCFEDGYDIIPVDKLEAPYTALKVNGLALDDGAYPLVLRTALSVRREVYGPPSASGAADKRNPSSGKYKKTEERLAAKAGALEELLKQAPKPFIAERPAVFRVVSGGDVMLDRGASDLLLKEGPAGIFGETAALLKGADLALVNLEGAVSTRGVKTPKSFNFRIDPKTAPVLRDTGIKAALLANNHIFDYGETAFLDSLDHLEKAGIGILGAGLNEDKASRPFAVQTGAGSARCFGIASFPREANGWDGLTAAAGPEKAGMLHAGKGGAEKLKAHFSPDDNSLDIVLFHGGVEWSTRPNTYTRELYTGLAESGASLIVGSHPHIVQGFEWVGGKPVFWSLGNYVFGGMDNTDGSEQGLFISLGFYGKKLVYLEPYALSLTHIRTTIAPPENLDVFYRRSEDLRDK